MRAHVHPCADCGTPVECDGELTRNHDGYPAATCSVRHRVGGTVEESVCEACAAAREKEGKA